VVARLTHFELIADRVPVDGVLVELEANPQLWNQHSARKTAPGTPHAQMSDIWVRYAPWPFGPGILEDPHVPVWYPAWEKLPSLRPLVFDLMARVQGEMLGGVLITKIPPGCVIDPHADAGWHVEYYEKFYLSLQSEPGAKFGCSHRQVNEELEPKPGEVWLFDNRKMHWVDNQSDRDRITCIICIRTDKFGRKPVEEI
jgi:hypothetical protein